MRNKWRGVSGRKQGVTSGREGRNDRRNDGRKEVA